MLGGVIYLAGCFTVTMLFNVPMNEALAALPPTAPDRTARWANYVSGWTTWNHVRTAASLGGRVAGYRAEQNRLSPHFVVVTAFSASGFM